ncbi:MAG: hypothetical protein KGJ62_06145 [Armatimonadetes bacterium]|nr:hypothetical protein [Armatimonadota bacterium]MDE2205905.1 hypothetical protein [Armatimonadota bacterium]
MKQSKQSSALALLVTAAAAALCPTGSRAQVSTRTWYGYGRGPQHQAQSRVGGQALASILWQKQIDLSVTSGSGELLIHYGSVMITHQNTVVTPIKTTSAGDFEVEGLAGATGATQWTVTSDWVPPPHDWYPVFGPVLAPNGRVYYPGAGGTVQYRDRADQPNTAPTGRIAFFGNAAYAADPTDFNNNVFINTPLTLDSAGDLYFGFEVTGTNPANLVSGLARIAPDGRGSYVSAVTLSGDTSMTKTQDNCTPAVSLDGRTVYVAVNNTTGTNAWGNGYICSCDSVTLAPIHHTYLLDPKSGDAGIVIDDSTASPLIGPDGDVYIGILENPFPENNDRGWLIHLDANLTLKGAPGAFGWDDTPSIVPSTMVPAYKGTSSYLLMCKYNNYVGIGTGNGDDKIAVLDPNATETDPVSGWTTMNEVMTDDQQLPSPAGGVHEWCINSAAIDPVTKAIFANCEDGHIYRWDMTTGTLTQTIGLTSGIGEAYTCTVIGPDGKVYALNDAILFACGTAP